MTLCVCVCFVPQTPAGTLSSSGVLQPGVFGVLPSVYIQPSLAFSPANWSTPARVEVAPVNTSGFTDYKITVFTLSFRFRTADPFYLDPVAIVPAQVLTSTANAGCPSQYTCHNGVRVWVVLSRVCVCRCSCVCVCVCVCV